MRLLRKSKAALVGGLFHFSVTKRPGGLFWAQRGLWIRSGGPQAEVPAKRPNAWARPAESSRGYLSLAVGSADGSGFRLARARENIRETTRRTAPSK
jgi:hypothetical protein